jgi:hypothetical protein
MTDVAAVPPAPSPRLAQRAPDLLVWGGVLLLLLISFHPVEMQNATKLITNSANMREFGAELLKPDWTDWKTSAPAAAGGWSCVEFHLDATDNRVTVYQDGVEQSDLTVSTKHHGGTADDFVFPTFDKLKLGWQLYQAGPTPSSYDVRMDDVALSTRRVGGCAP